MNVFETSVKVWRNGAWAEQRTIITNSPDIESTRRTLQDSCIPAGGGTEENPVLFITREFPEVAA